ncbi:hypothetical protein L4D76_19870 [Photobacterium sagamiensis]|uniref:hypothetical protein n=1 Tax=Photobacterium sagamiensis TaxID=2910241 RepID=UPI003D12F203
MHQQTINQQAISCDQCDYHINNVHPQSYVMDQHGNRITANSLSHTFKSIYGVSESTINAVLKGQINDGATEALQKMILSLSGKLYTHSCQECAAHFTLDPSKDKHACPHCWSQSIAQINDGDHCPKCGEGKLN